MSKLLYGIGVNDLNNKSKLNGKPTVLYQKWHSMLERCYSEKYQSRFPTYVGCRVDSEWHLLSGFSEWFDETYVDGYHLDKDILVPNNKIYSPSTCIFVPRWVNSFVVDSSASRGEHPIGVTMNNRGRYQSFIHDNGKRKYLGTYDTPEEAHYAWRVDKIKQIELRKVELDNIHGLLYHSLMERYKESL